MDAAKVKVALRRHIGDVCRDPPLLAQLPDDRRGRRIVDGDQHHIGSIEVGRLEDAVDMGDLVLRDAVCDLFVEAGSGTYDGDVGVGIEAVEDAAGGDLEKL